MNREISIISKEKTEENRRKPIWIQIFYAIPMLGLIYVKVISLSKKYQFNSSPEMREEEKTVRKIRSRSESVGKCWKVKKEKESKERKLLPLEGR